MVSSCPAGSKQLPPKSLRLPTFGTFDVPSGCTLRTADWIFLASLEGQLEIQFPDSRERLIEEQNKQIEVEENNQYPNELWIPITLLATTLAHKIYKTIMLEKRITARENKDTEFEYMLNKRERGAECLTYLLLGKQNLFVSTYFSTL